MKHKHKPKLLKMHNNLMINNNKVPYINNNDKSYFDFITFLYYNVLQKRSGNLCLQFHYA